MSDNRKQPLKGEVVDGRLVITIGVDMLSAYLERHIYDINGGLAVSDADAAANAIAQCIVGDDDDGFEPMEEAFKLAADQAIRDSYPEYEQAGLKKEEH